MKPWLLLCACLLCARVRADSTPPPSTPLHQFFPSAHARNRDRLEHAQRSAQQMLGELPHVRSARVHLSWPDPEGAPLDAPLPSPRAQVVLQLAGEGPTDAQLLRLLQSLMPELSPTALTVQRFSTASPPPARQLVKVGPFAVPRESALTLRIVLALSFTANALLAVLLLARRRQRARKAQRSVA